jgi:FkbM family methyltransferase
MNLLQRRAYRIACLLWQAFTGRNLISRLPIIKAGRIASLGQGHGAWRVAIDAFPVRGTCFSFGIGLDASFDLALIDHRNATVHAFDPTPGVLTYATSIANREPQFRFHPHGIYDRDGDLFFHAPANAAHISHSLLNLQKTLGTGFTARCRRLKNIMQDLGHDHIDLLKIDIEGAEYAVLESLLEDRLDVRAICVEFDEAHTPMNGDWQMRIRGICKRLAGAGYHLVAAKLPCNLTFVRLPT